MERKLAPVHAARFDGNGNPNGCLLHTRVKLLDQIDTWIADDSPSSPDFFCLTGLAGTGKTTVAQSVCMGFDRTRILASFLASRTSADRRSPERIIQSIAYQLGIQQAAVQGAIDSALQNDRDVTTRPLPEQVADLFATPLEALEASSPPVLVVIDALDECDKVAGREGGELIPLIVSAIRKLSRRVKLLITSREEPAVMAMLKAMGLNTPQSLVQLQKIEDIVVKADIEAFFHHHFRRIAELAGFEDPDSWPTEADFDLVVEQTGKLFVYATLVIRLFEDLRTNPETILEEVLRPSAPSASGSPLQGLDDLYLTVLEKAVAASEASAARVVQRVRKVLAALILLQTPVNAHTLSKLLDEDLYDIQQDIKHLSAVLLIPDKADDSITIFHLSFLDFVTTRCSDERFRVDPQVYHALLSRCCLAAMSRCLKYDVCEIGDFTVMNRDIKDLEVRRERVLPHEVRYACKYWAVHASNAGHSEDELPKVLGAFCNQHLLHWAEALSLLGELSAGQTSLPDIIRWCKVSTCSVIISWHIC